MSPSSPPELFARRYGDGPRVYVGLHGWNGSHRTFDPLVAHLPEDASLYVLDLPGYGASPAPEEWSLEAVGRAILAELDASGVEDFHLIGNCSGAVVGLAVAREAGEELGHFYLLEPFAFVPWYLRLLLVPLAGRFFYWLSFGTPLGRRIANAAMADRRSEETDLMAAFADNRLEVPYQYLRMFGRLGRPERYGDIGGHKHLVRAGGTFGAVRRSVERWAEIWPGADRHRLEESGHLLIEEAPAELAQILFAPRNDRSEG